MMKSVQALLLASLIGLSAGIALAQPGSGKGPGPGAGPMGGAPPANASGTNPASRPGAAARHWHNPGAMPARV